MRLFSPEELLFLAKVNLGLRLAPSYEASKPLSGLGDAIPLSHLAGANDIVEFVTLALLNELTQAQKSSMEKIYKNYKEAGSQSTHCMPRLILHYAVKHNIDDAVARAAVQNNTMFISPHLIRGIEAEAEVLANNFRSFPL